MKYYVEAFGENGQILGNCDGQGVLHCVRWDRTNHYKRMRDGKIKTPYVKYWRIVTPQGNIVKTINNSNYRGK